MRWLPALLLFLSAPAFATDVDLFRGLKWFEANDTEEIRLLGIEPHTLPPGIGPYRLLVPEDAFTRHGELLAHVMLIDGTWLQDKLVREGEAIVMPVFEQDDLRLQHLLAAEDQAHLAKRGQWAKSPIVCAGSADDAYDVFAIIQGRITKAADVRGTIYLNFGDDYRKDFTIKIARSIFKTLPEETQTEITRLTNGGNFAKIVETRGWVFYSGGPMIEVKMPVQLRFFETDNPLVEESCTS